MKEFPKKSALLFAAAMAFCTFAMPSMASASSWGLIGTHHRLDSTNLGFINDASGIVANCTRSQFTAEVISGLTLQFTNGTFTGCGATGGGVGSCTTTWTGTNFPWTATASTTTNIQIHGVDVDVLFETTPGGGTSCVLDGASLRITGTLTTARWTGNGTGLRGIELNGATNLVGHAPFLPPNSSITLTGTVTDNTQNTLTVTS